MYKETMPDRKNQIATTLSAIAATHICMTAPAWADDNIDQVLSQRSITFSDHAPSHTITEEFSNNIFSAHLEKGRLSGLMHAGNLAIRHAEAAAFSMYYGAAAISGKKPDIRAYDIDPNIGTTIARQDDPTSRAIMQYMIENASALSISKNQNEPSIRVDEFAPLYQEWMDSRTIITQSAGNNGDYSRTPCIPNSEFPSEPQEFIFAQISDTYAKTGTATISEDTGEVVIDKYSSCSGADLLGLNPYEQGLSYQFYTTKEEFLTLLEEHRDNLISAVSNPSDILERLARNRAENLDKDGFRTNIPGNSFVAPTMAGYFTGAEEI